MSEKTDMAVGAAIGVANIVLIGAVFLLIGLGLFVGFAVLIWLVDALI